MEAAHLWERAAGKELDGKRRTLYAANAEAARERSEAAAQKPAQALSDVKARMKLV